MLFRCADEQAERGLWSSQNTVRFEWCSFNCTHPDLCTPFPQPPPTPPKRSQPPQVTTDSAWVQRGNWPATTQQRGIVCSDGHSLTASESSNPCRYKLSYMERWDSKSSVWNENSEDQPLPERMEGEDSGVTKTSRCLCPHEGRPQSRQQQIKKTKVEQCVFLMLNWMLLSRSRESVGSHYESAWSSPEAEQTWHFICLPSSDHTSQSDSPALDDDRSEMQPADWPTEAPLHSTEQGRGSREGGGGVFCSTRGV